MKEKKHINLNHCNMNWVRLLKATAIVFLTFILPILMINLIGIEMFAIGLLFMLLAVAVLEAYVLLKLFNKS